MLKQSARCKIALVTCALIVLFHRVEQWQVARSSWVQVVEAKDTEGEEPESQPPFPEPIVASRKQFKITSEIIDEHETTSRTLEEYVDLALGKASFVINTREGNSVRHLDADEELSFIYAPYKCSVTAMSSSRTDDGPNTLNDISSELVVYLKGTSALTGSVIDGRNKSMAEPTKSRPLRLFGVSGLWLLAASKPKSFMKVNLIYSATTDAYRPAYVWHMDHENLGLDFYFSAPVGSASEPALEMIKISSRTEKALLRTINILAIDNVLAPEVYDDILSVPLGYGCFSSLSDDMVDRGAEDSAEWAELVSMRRSFVHRHRVDAKATWVGRAELEVTASTLIGDNAQAKPARRSSDTYSVEIAQTSSRTDERFNGTMAMGPFVKLVRWRNSREDKKLVMDQLIQLKYTIDMLRGTCEMAHFTAQMEGESEQVLIKFANGAQFDANIELFKESDRLHFIKVTTSQIDGRRLHHYEGTAASKELIQWLRTSTGVTEEAARRTRVVRSYTVGENSLELVSVTIWLLDELESSIVESYQIYVIDYREDSGNELAEDLARQFDISFECYLENEQMVQNRDFAWFQLSYPVSQRLLGVVADNWQALKQMYYEHYFDDIMRVPKVELLLEEDRFKIRTLLLDLPPVELVYDKLSQVQLKPASEQFHDVSYFEPDLKHCSHLCRRHHCTVMTYCSDTKSCILTHRAVYDFDDATMGPVERKERFEYASAKMCDTYKITPILEQRQTHKRMTLASILARVQHQNYDVQLDLPPPPDELTLDESEGGLSQEAREQALAEYESKVYDLIRAGNRVPELAFAVKLANNFVFLLPDKFELERDPLDQFQLHSNQLEENEVDGDMSNFDDDDDKVPHFHKGKQMARFNIAGQHKVAFHSFRGLNYDQCASACWDGKCGTFSFCEQGGECILSSAKTLGHAQALGIVEEALDCFIAQRDFLGNFVKFPNVFRPQVYKRRTTKPVTDVSECALDCVAETDFHCLSFQYCTTSATEDGQMAQCYFQASHHSLNEEAPTPTGCDHYARSQLADFVRLDSRRVIPEVVQQLKTDSYDHLTVFGCAEKCLNELVDCTAFQFCHYPAGAFRLDGTPDPSALPLRECLTIESKVTPSMLKALNKTDGETIVDETTDEGQIVKSGDFLAYDTDCQVFSLRKDSTQAHLRDLAFGGLIDVSSSSKRNVAERGGGGVLGAIFLYLSVAAVSTGVTCGAIVLARRNQFVRRHLARLRLVNY